MTTSIICNQLYAEAASIGNSESKPHIDRVCAVDLTSDEIVLICVTQPDQSLRIESLSKFQARLAKLELRLLQDDFLAKPLGSPSSRARAARAFLTIRKLVTCHVRELCFRAQRAPLLLQAAKEHNCCVTTIRSRVRAWFVYGMTEIALQGNHDKCGGTGKSRIPGEKLLGRHCKNSSLNSSEFRMAVDEPLAEKMHSVWHLHSDKGLSEAYGIFLDQNFTISFKKEQGKIMPVHATQRPSLRQFEYRVVEQQNRRRYFAALNQTAREFNLKSRKLGEYALARIYGPGHEYQLDGTGGLVHLISSLDRGIEIGKAKCYFAVDKYSHAVVGYALVLENFCSSALAVVLECSFSDKVEHCRALGIVISETDWSMRVVCKSVLADGGPEMMGFSSEFFAANFQIDWKTAPAYRADFKDAVERQHGHMKDENQHVDGANRQMLGRCERDPRRDACLTLRDFEIIIVHYILHFNATHEVKNHPDAAHLIALGQLPTPNNLWRWGMQNRSGEGRHFDKKTIFERLLLRASGGVSRKGIEFFGLVWFSATMDASLENLRLRGFKSKRVSIGYKKESVARIYLLGERGEILETCELIPEFYHYKYCSFWEIEQLRDTRAPIAKAAEIAKYESKSGLRHTKKTIIEEAKLNQIAAGVDKPKFSQEVRDREKEILRQNRAADYEDLAPAPAISSRPPVSVFGSYDEELDGDLSK